MRIKCIDTHESTRVPDIHCNFTILKNYVYSSMKYVIVVQIEIVIHIGNFNFLVSEVRLLSCV